MIGDEVCALGFGREGNGFLRPGHDGGFGARLGRQRGMVGCGEDELQWEGPDGVEEGGEERKDKAEDEEG